MLTVRRFDFTGYQNYEETQNILKEILLEAFHKDNVLFRLAINEAVCNAARYALAGVKNVQIYITVRITDSDVKVSVYAETRNFDAKAYQQKLLALLDNKDVAKLQWSDYTKDTEKSRGFWYILTAVDYLVVTDNGSEVTLCARRPFDGNEDMPRTLEFLIPKFLVKQNGVIE